ncbi:MAG: acetyl-CoA C-acyltransferase [Sphingomonadales bacterium]|nr:acetyl-CoA C-acyltransferase [Sphingomonadales bacterium]
MNAYIIAGLRSAVTKAPKGGFRFTRPDDLAAEVIHQILADIPQLDPRRIDELIVGNAVPEAEQGMQIGRIVSLLALPKEVPGMVVNRYCGSGLESIAIAAQRIHSKMADLILAGGTESMSLVPVMGWKTALNYNIASTHGDYYTSMGLTAEMVAREYHISRDDQDAFALASHTKAMAALDSGRFKSQIAPVVVEEIYVDERMIKQKRSNTIDTDEGPRRDTSLEALSKLKPVFAQGGTVTAGNSSQTSDGAAFVLVASEKMVRELGIEPLGRMISYATRGVEPRVMGIGPVVAVPLALSKAGLRLQDLEQIELNEAFAAQSLAVIRQLDLNPDLVNLNGGAIALGHPLGCSGAKLSLQLLHEMRQRGQRYGLVTACVGGGQGVAGIFESYST